MDFDNDKNIDLISTSITKDDKEDSTHKKSIDKELIDDITSKYLREISKYPLLTKEEEFKLAELYFKTKDITAAHKLITSNLRFVVKIASEYVRFGLKLIDLIQEGNIGLMVAVKKFNPYKGVRLTSYAVWWIRSYIHDYMLSQWSMVKIGTTANQKKLFYRLREEQEKLKRYLEEQSMPKLLEYKIIADKLNVKEEEVKQMDIRLKSSDLSLDEPIKEEDNLKYLDTIEDPGPKPLDLLSENLTKEEFLEYLEQFKDNLTPRDLFILENRLLSDKPLSLQEIGDKYNISKERARQLEEKIKKNLKKFILSKNPNFTL